MYKDKYENKIKIGKKLMAFDPVGKKPYRCIGKIIEITFDHQVVIYNEKLPDNYKIYTIPYEEVLKYLRDKLYK